jgi:taurine dioxygenase
MHPRVGTYKIQAGSSNAVVAACRFGQYSRATMLEIRPLSPAIGVEFIGVDLAQPLDETDFARLRTAWENNCIALFRQQTLDEMAQVRFAGRFGPLGVAVNDLDPAKGGSHPAILYVSNVRVADKVSGILPDGEMFFHSDTCYMERPAMASMLYAIEIPPSGGNTLYANASGRTPPCPTR